MPVMSKGRRGPATITGATRLCLAWAIIPACLGLWSCDGKSGGDGGVRTEEVVSRSHPPKTARTEAELLPPREAWRRLLEQRSQESGPELDRALAELAWELIDEDPGLAEKAIKLLPADHPDRLRLLQHFALRLAESDPGAACAWASALESDDDRSLVCGRIAVVIAEKDPEKAAEVLSETGLAGRDFEVSVVEVLQRWSAVDAVASMRWVVQFPAGRLREESLRTVMGRWLETDAPAAVTWLESIGDPSLKPEAERAIGEAMKGMDSESREKAMENLGPAVRARIEVLSPADGESAE